KPVWRPTGAPRGAARRGDPAGPRNRRAPAQRVEAAGGSEERRQPAMSNSHAQDKPTTIVIFGASGDLTQRKLMPAIFSLFHKHRLPKNFQIVGAARTEQDDDGFRRELHEAMKQFAGYQFDEQDW